MKKQNSKNSGQVMLLSALLIGGSILAATSVAGYLMLLQIRQSTNIANSGKAITAASSGIDRALYFRNRQFFSETLSSEYFSNGAEVKINKTDDIITAVGNAGNSYRAFSLDISGQSTLPPED